MIILKPAWSVFRANPCDAVGILLTSFSVVL